MKRLSIVLLMAAFAAGAWSQNQVTLRQQNFPTALPMVEDNVEWQRDVYRELDLHDDRNAGLYCPVEPSKIQQGLFMKVFQLAVSRIRHQGYSGEPPDILPGGERSDYRG